MDEVREGGCACGAVRYRTAGAPVRVTACCCRWCQRRTGAPLGLSVYFERPQVTFLAEPAGRHRVVSDAGRWLEGAFCTACGTTVTWLLEMWPERRGIAGGTFDDPAGLPDPVRFVFARGRPRWLTVCADVETFEAMP